MNFSAIETLTIASLLLVLGYRIRAWVRVLDRLNIPAPVIGGFLMAVLAVVLRRWHLGAVKFDLVTEQPLMIAFFTSIGFGAGMGVLRRGGPKILWLFVLAAIVAVLQGLLGAAIARAFSLPPLYGVLTGTVTLSGGPATAMAFAPLFEKAGVHNAAGIGIATAMAGIVIAGMLGAPLATWLINRDRLGKARPANVPVAMVEAAPAEDKSDPVVSALVAITLVLAAMWGGTKLSNAIQSAGVTLPSYVGAMVVAALLRNICDAMGRFKLPLAAIEIIGAVTLSLFLTMALMAIDLASLADLALPFFVNLVAQSVMLALLILWPIYGLLGRDYEAAVTGGGFFGFMMGTTANAMAVLRALVEKYAPAPQSFLAVPMVGTFLIDFANALIITAFLNLLR
ncbi:MAG TPA: sodium/glutamate symporter [Rhizomicrobium sp.]|nr:sodium/glutamate symporter [Rhizomicrobium sp.]